MNEGDGLKKTNTNKHSENYINKIDQIEVISIFYRITGQFFTFHTIRLVEKIQFSGEIYFISSNTLVTTKYWWYIWFLRNQTKDVLGFWRFQREMKKRNKKSKRVESSRGRQASKLWQSKCTMQQSYDSNEQQLHGSGNRALGIQHTRHAPRDVIQPHHHVTMDIHHIDHRPPFFYLIVSLSPVSTCDGIFKTPWDRVESTWTNFVEQKQIIKTILRMRERKQLFENNFSNCYRQTLNIIILEWDNWSRCSILGHYKWTRFYGPFS